MLFNIPVSFIVIFSLAVIIILSRFFKNLHIPVTAGAFFIPLVCGVSLTDTLQAVKFSLTSLNNILLITVMVLIIILSSQMSETGFMKKLVESVRIKVNQKTAVALLPALIGLLPMPGGALFSAPLVQDCDRNNIPSLKKTNINFWFRHIWEYWWPLYPGVLLAIDITGLNTGVFILTLMPLTLFSVGTGYFFLLKKLPPPKKELNTHSQRINNKTDKITYLLSPLFVIIAVYAVIRIFFPTIPQINKYLPMLTGIVSAVIYLQFLQPLSPDQWKKIILSPRLINLALLILLIRMYGAFLEIKLPSGLSPVETMRNEFVHLSIPLYAVIIILPFICGITTGLAVGFVGASFPIVFMMLGESPSVQTLMTASVLAYGFGYLGMLLSPVHVCLIVSNKHFRTNLFHSIKKLILPASVMALLILIYAALIHFCMPLFLTFLN